MLVKVMKRNETEMNDGDEAAEETSVEKSEFRLAMLN